MLNKDWNFCKRLICTWISAVVKLLTRFAAVSTRLVAVVCTQCIAPFNFVSIFTTNLAALHTTTGVATRVSKASLITVRPCCSRPAEIRIFIAICTSYKVPTICLRKMKCCAYPFSHWLLNCLLSVETLNWLSTDDHQSCNLLVDVLEDLKLRL